MLDGIVIKKNSLTPDISCQSLNSRQVEMRIFKGERKMRLMNKTKADLSAQSGCPGMDV